MVSTMVADQQEERTHEQGYFELAEGNAAVQQSAALHVSTLQEEEALADEATEEQVLFNRDVRAILSDSCYACHGPDGTNRAAYLRLDQAANEDGMGGHDVISPGNPEGSELYRRLTSHDPELQMPPHESGRPSITPEAADVIRRWIEQGAVYEDHWAFVPPVQPELPEVASEAWVRNGIDAFVLARLEEEELQPSPEASRETLIRRVTFDLTGLPPTLEEIDAFLADDEPGAYERVVDRLLASPRYGERMTIPWLDLARYADTSGYQYDGERKMWAWREWVIAAYNENKPFDEFTVEQLAGDLLPNATVEQRIATGFNRNHPITVEGGVIDEEYRNEYVIDRVITMGNVWLGMTVGCARCHDHKYDPLPQADFYQIYAFFNQMQEHGRGTGNRARPRIEVVPPLRQRQIDALQSEIESIGEQIAALRESAPEGEEQIAELRQQRTACNEELQALRSMRKTHVMILADDTERRTFVLRRGQYDLPDANQEVFPEVPSFLPPLAEGAPRNRLGLAQWLVDPSHPLTSRVAVNRYWTMYFGVGLVKTAEDFGLQGEWPSHPDLLDWLATEFIGSGWDIKGMQRLIVTSATYRQASATGSELLTRDPENRLLARGPRFRLEAEFVRDNVLATSGLLVEQLGGRSVFPYHPTGLWLELNNRPGSSRAYPQGEGDSLYRRSMYTYWKRSVPPPSLNMFDAPEREFCTLRRSRTNTPLQALVLMHDPQYVEAARCLARRMMTEGGDTLQEQVAYGFRLTTSRLPTPEEYAVLQMLYQQERELFGDDPTEALARLSVGDSPRDESLDPIEHASIMAVARIMLNLHESVTRE